MPTYVYQCSSCGERFEAWQKITDDPIDICPTCGQPVHRVVFPVGLVFKGGGFYKTDSRGASSATVEGSDKTASNEPAASSTETKKVEAKPAESKPVGEKSSSKPVTATAGE